MMVEGLLLIDKPAGMTSHDVVQTVRRKLGVRRIGHTGTLDPMAEGLLILLVGPATKFQQALQGHEKTYEAVIRLGTQTDTGDAMGRTVRTAAVPALVRDRVAALLTSFEGELDQTPPAYSAVKVRGRPAYWWARRQQPVTLSARRIRLADMTVVDCGSDTITFRVRCSAGTYIRTLAESIAGRFGTVGHLTKLVRWRIGEWRREDAKPLAWIAQASAEMVARELQPTTAAGHPRTFGFVGEAKRSRGGGRGDANAVRSTSLRTASRAKSRDAAGGGIAAAHDPASVAAHA